jgi:alpha-tubulin suppressor-like RCC1 family protein
MKNFKTAFGITLGAWALTAWTAAQCSTVPHSGVLQIFSGPTAQGACAILADHRMSCWGSGGSFVETNSINGLRIKSVAVGSNTVCALLEDTSVWCKGDNTHGQLGNGTFGGATTDFGPVIYARLFARRQFGDVTAIVGGTRHFCALKSDTSVWCWGSNSDDQLGDFSVPDGADSNVPVTVVVALGHGSSKPLNNAMSITAGAFSTCASLLETDGTYSGACWGNNIRGQLGNGESGTDSNSPTAVSIDGDPTHKLGIAPLPGSIMAGDIHTCTLVPNADPYSVACFGNNFFGETSSGVSSNELPKPVIFPDSTPLTGASALATGYTGSCVILVDRTVACWGDNSHGEMGNHALNYNHAFSPVPVTNFDGSTLGDIQQIVMGQYFTCALTTNRSVLCWGDNSKQQLGVGQPHGPKDTPVETPVDGPIFYDGLGD